MPFHEPFLLGPFVVETDGTLRPASAEAPPTFAFRWRGRVVRAALDDGHEVTVRAVLGRVPSTASERASVRRQSFELLRALRGNAPEGWRVGLLADHRAMLQASVKLAAPATVTGLLTAVTGFLLDLAPYLDMMDDAGLPVAG